MKKIKLMLSLALIPGMFLLNSSAIFAQTDEKTEVKEVEKEVVEKNSGDTEFFRGGIKVERKGDDTTIVYIKNNPWHHGKHDGKMKWPWSKNKFNGHWAGVELGWNGYLTPDFDMNFPANESYLELKWARSLGVNLNPFELNLNLAKNHFGLVSGIGFSLNNYYFNNSTYLTGDSSTLVAYELKDGNGVPADMKVNKLFVSWLTVPVIFEYQTRSGLHMDSFHVGLGIVGAVRLCSYTKQEFYSRNTSYYLEDGENTRVGTLYVGEKPIRNKDQFYLNPFKVDATFRIGWSFLNLWANYSITGMFQDNKGPDVYPYSVGITLVGW